MKKKKKNPFVFLIWTNLSFRPCQLHHVVTFLICSRILLSSYKYMQSLSVFCVFDA